MGRHSSGGSYGHSCSYDSFCGGYYRISWVVDHYYANSRQRFPRHYDRNTDEIGARKFCKKWDLAFPVTHNGD